MSISPSEHKAHLKDDDNSDQQENHDDCEDCRRQRAENEALISIYEKLQDINKKTSNVKQEVKKHKDIIFSKREKIQSFDSKMQQIKEIKKNQTSSQFEQMGYSLFTDLMEKSISNSAQQENTRLKNILKNINKQRQNNKQPLLQPIAKDSATITINPENRQPQQISDKPLISMSNNDQNQSQSSSWFEIIAEPKTSHMSSSNYPSSQLMKCEKLQQNSINGNTSTKSTFTITKRKLFDKKDYEDLNLWLFEDNKNSELQQELYSPFLSKGGNIYDSTCEQLSMSFGIGRNEVPKRQLLEGKNKLLSLSSRFDKSAKKNQTTFAAKNASNNINRNRRTLSNGNSPFKSEQKPKEVKLNKSFRQDKNLSSMEQNRSFDSKQLFGDTNCSEIGGKKSRIGQTSIYGRRNSQKIEQSGNVQESSPKKYQFKRYRGSVLPAISN